jgi:hypothetical protein
MYGTRTHIVSTDTHIHTQYVSSKHGHQTDNIEDHTVTTKPDLDLGPIGAPLFLAHFVLLGPYRIRTILLCKTMHCINGLLSPLPPPLRDTRHCSHNHTHIHTNNLSQPPTYTHKPSLTAPKMGRGVGGASLCPN